MLTLSTSTTLSKHVRHEKLELAGFLLEEEEESGLALEEQEAAGGEAPWREREPEAPLAWALALAASAFFISLAAVIDILLGILRSL
jgi:hypothetical protein